MIMNMGLRIITLLLLGLRSHAERTDRTVYHRRNGSFCIPVGKQPPHEVDLSFLSTMVVNRNKSHPDYKDRVEYVQRENSWCLHNLSEKDNGIYEFSVIKKDTKNTTYHQLVVEEAVPKPVLQVMDLSCACLNLSQPCTTTVNCSVWEDWVLSHCNDTACNTSIQSSGPRRAVNITVSAGNGSVTCSGSNHISTSNVTRRTCFNDSSGPGKNTQILMLTGLALGGVVCVMCAICALYFTIKHILLYIKMDVRPTKAARAATVSSRVSIRSSQSEVAYENMDVIQNAQEERADIVHSLYSVVERPVREAPPPRQPTEVDTVYSVLQKA